MLRLVRSRAGYSLADLAGLIHYSVGYLSKVENGLRNASHEFAVVCDAALDAGGELVRLQRTAAKSRPLRLDAPRRRRLEPVAAVDSQESWYPPPTAPDGDGKAAVTAFTAMFGTLRSTAQTVGPGNVLPIAEAQLRSLAETASCAKDSALQERLLGMAARWAEFNAWMAQEAGDDARSLRWVQSAAEFGHRANDPGILANALIRRSLLALYQGDGAATVELAHRAGILACDPKIGTRAALREAQGHALLCDEYRTRQALDAAADLFAIGTRALLPSPERARDPAEAGGSTGTAAMLQQNCRIHDLDRQLTFGTIHLNDPVAVTTAWCLTDLGRPRQALDLLLGELPRIDRNAHRARVRYLVRLALTAADCGELDLACSLAQQSLPLAAAVDSATLRVELRRLVKMLGRRRGHPPIRGLLPLLAAAARGRYLE